MERNVYIPTKDKPYRLPPKSLTNNQTNLVNYVSTTKRANMQDVRTLAYLLYQECLINGSRYCEIVESSYDPNQIIRISAFNSILFSANEAKCGKIIYPDNEEE